MAVARGPIRHLPTVLVAATVLGLWLHGPVPQIAGYHDFADQRSLFGIPHAANVLSNLGFALVGAWGAYHARGLRALPPLRRGSSGYLLFLYALGLTALGSGWYHLAPDNARLFWDRLPIALASAGLVAAVQAETSPRIPPRDWTWLLAIAGAASVAWWAWTDRRGNGDLGPYLLVNLMPLLLIPLWQSIHGAPRADRHAFLLAIGLYAAAKVAELQDRQIQALLGFVSGHTLKHLLATAAGAAIVVRLVQRLRLPVGAAPAGHPREPEARRA